MLDVSLETKWAKGADEGRSRRSASALNDGGTSLLMGQAEGERKKGSSGGLGGKRDQS